MSWLAIRALQNCCNLGFCQSHTVKTRLRVGTTLGLRDEPLNAALSRKCYDQMPGAFVEWIQLPVDTRAVAAMLHAGILDVAAVQTEEALTHLCSESSELRVCGMFQGCARRWCCLVPQGVSGVSRANLCSHPIAIAGSLASKLMALVLRDRLQCVESSLRLVETDDLNTALRLLFRGGKVSAVLWEIGPLERTKIKEACSIAEEFVMPWPSHLLISSKETLFSKLCTIRYLTCFTNLLCQDFQMDASGDLLDYLVTTYPEVYVSEVRSWLCNATWTCATDVEAAALAGPLQLFMRMGMLPSDCKPPVYKYLARGVRLRNAEHFSPPIPTCRAGEPSDSDSQDEQDIDDSLHVSHRGAVPALLDSRFNTRLARCHALCGDEGLAAPQAQGGPQADVAGEVEEEEGSGGSLEEKMDEMPAPAG